MAGTISNLGLTFSGAESNLSAETIEKLKEADKTAMLKPTERNLEKVFSQQEDLKELKKHIGNLENKASHFSDELNYLKRSTRSFGEGGSVKVNDGVDPQSGSIHVNHTAKQSIVESRGFEKLSTVINNTDENMLLKFKADGKTVEVDITPNMTLEDLKYAINDASEGKVIASALNTGGDDPFKLIIKSTQTGEKQKIEIIDDHENAFDLNLSVIQEASDANFVYNGVNITRETNTIDDLYMGVTVQLEKDNADINFEVTRDLEGMTESMQEFVDAYNESMKFIDEITGYDAESGESGSFQGDFRVNNIQSSLNQELFKYVDEQNMTDFGLDLTKEGDLLLDQAQFSAKMNEDPDAMQKFFLGGTEITPSTYTSKVIGVEYVANSTNVNGKQINNFIEQPLSQDLTIPKGSIKINDVELGEVTLLASNSPSQNAQVLMSAINAASDESYVTASLTGSGRQIHLTDESGERFTIKSSDGWAERVGLSSGTYVGKVEEKVGIFANIDSFFERLNDGSNATLSLLDTNLTSSEDRLTDELQRTLDRINAKYETMATQFAAYNSIISGYESSFKSVQMQIEAMANAK